jgi:outer membrane receptor protein involved in Fe transport
VRRRGPADSLREASTVSAAPGDRSGVIDNKRGVSSFVGEFMRFMYRLAGCALGATIPSLVAIWAYGQEGGLEEIVVTATRREESLQQVPISIVAVTGEGLEMRGLDSLERVSQAIPNLVVTGGGGGTAQPNFTVRGIPNVGTYIDGVWQVGTAGLLTQEFVDVDRIEVLRGPQGTTFGRDSTGGAIRIWTKKPSDTYSADVSATVGTLDRRDVKLSVNLPITDKLLTKWTGASLYRDGYIHDLTTGQNNGGIDQTVFHGDIAAVRDCREHPTETSAQRRAREKTWS